MSPMRGRTTLYVLRSANQGVAKEAEEVSQVDLAIVYAWDDAWACYVNGKLVDQNNGIFRATQLIDILKGRGIRRWDSIDLGEATEEFPKTLFAVKKLIVP